MKHSDFDVGRISALSDGVFAIAMTLLVLDLGLPDTGPVTDSAAFAALLVQQVPRFLSWLLSFALLCRLWILDHDVLADGDTRSWGFLAWSFVFLGCISFIPFPTSLLAEHADQPWSIVIFSATYASAGIALAGMLQQSVKGGFFAAKQTDAERGSKRAVILLLSTAAVACVAAFWNPGFGALAWCTYPIASALIRRKARRQREAASPPAKD